MYIDEGVERSIQSQEGPLREWSREFFRDMRRLPERSARIQTEQFDLLNELSVGPIRTMRNGIASVLDPPNEKLGFQAALQLPRAGN